MTNLPYFFKASGLFKNICQLVDNPWGDPILVKIFHNDPELIADEGTSSILSFV